MQKDDLPSIQQIVPDNNLPSIDDFLAEEAKQELPSVEDFVEKEEEEIKELVEEFTLNEKSLELNEVLRLINDVRESIPDIPEIKYYDKELEDICESIQILASSIPEVKYYDSDIEKLQKDIQEVRSEIPVFPKWVNEINEVPDFSWIGKTFSVIDDDFVKVNDTIETLRERVEVNIREVIEENETKNFETQVKLGNEIKKLDEKYQEVKDRIWKEFRESSLKIWEYHKEFKDDDRKLKKQITNEYNILKNNLEEKLKKFNENSIKTDQVLLDYFKSLKEEITGLPEVKYYDDEIKYVREDIKDLYDLVKTIKSEQKDLQESLQESILREPPETEESIGVSPDPLTPLDQKFATLDDLANHYRIFINRIQTQLSTMGGGGAGFIKDLDDVSFDQTTGNNKLLIYDQANSKWVGIASTALFPVGIAGTWAVDAVGINTVKNIGIGTTARFDQALYVQGNATFTGNISVAGTITYDDVTNVDSIGIITARQDINVDRNLFVSGITTLGASNGIGTVTIGVGSTALYVDGSARITGILTVGKSSVTIDGDNNTITTGIVTVTNSTIYIGDSVTISGTSSGINSAPNVLYVAKDGNDLNNGTTIDNAKLTIASAVGIATTGTIIKVLAGNYLENNPIEVPAFVSIVGDDLKTVTISPNVANQDLFHVRKGCYITGMTFTNHVYPAAAISFPTTEVATNVGGGKWESPYIQNCTSNTTTGTGLRIDGNQAEGLKSIVCDSYTQYNQGGVGVAVTNGGYAQLVSVFTICCNEGVTAYKGGQCSLTNSNTDFGTYGLVSDGVSDLQFTGIVTASASAGSNIISLGISTTIRPYEGQVIYFDTLYYTVNTITVTNGGSGYTSVPTVSISSPTGPNGITATAFATLSGDSVSEITIISSGNQYTSSPSVTISAPDSGVTATATANIDPIYYTINSSTPISSGITTVTLDENLNNTIGIGTTAYFYQVSRITASSHTFEYVGSGNDITSATPLRGGVPIQENEIVTTNGGKVVFTSTDQAGNFRIGNDIVINQNNGTISGRAFTRSLFNQMTPFILALS